MSKKRTKYTSASKTKLVLELLQNESTLVQIASKQIVVLICWGFIKVSMIHNEAKNRVMNLLFLAKGSARILPSRQCNFSNSQNLCCFLASRLALVDRTTNYHAKP
jgi:hypothetical protein